MAIIDFLENLIFVQEFLALPESIFILLNSFRHTKTWSQLSFFLLYSFLTQLDSIILCSAIVVKCFIFKVASCIWLFRRISCPCIKNFYSVNCCLPDTYFYMLLVYFFFVLSSDYLLVFIFGYVKSKNHNRLWQMDDIEISLSIFVYD